MTLHEDALELVLYLLLGIGSALVPIINAEAAVAGTAALDRTWVASVVLIGVGQGLGKIALFMGVRRGGAWVTRYRSKGTPSAAPRSRARATIARWSQRLIAQLDRPVVGAVVVFVSAVAGFPPLLVVAVAAALSRASLRVFAVSVVCGRVIRFLAIAYPVASAAR